MNIPRMLRASVGLSVIVVSGCDDCSSADLIMAAATAIAGSGSATQFQAGSFNPVSAEHEVVGSRPDMIVNLGALITISGREANIGERAAGAHEIGVVQKSTVVGQADATLSQIPVAALGKGEQVDKSTKVQTISTGIAVLEMTADFLKAVEECDGKDGNNSKSVTGVTASATSTRYLVIRVIDPGKAEGKPNADARIRSDEPMARLRVIP